MASPVALMLAFTPLSSDASPVSLGLGHELLINTENSCGSFCLASSNTHFDVTMNALVSRAQIPQRNPKLDSSMSASPVSVNTFDVSWHPFYDGVVGAGYRTSERSAERTASGKVVRRLSAFSREIPISVAARPAESFSFAGRFLVRNIELKQENRSGSSVRVESYSAAPHRWSADALWQKDESTGFGISYTSPTQKRMTAGTAVATSASGTTAPIWTDPQEFTFSIAHFSSIHPPTGITFGPFENVFHASFTAVTWESGKPVAYAALASGSTTKDGWNLADTSGQTQEFVFDTLDPSLSVSAGLESTWMRTSLGSIASLTHVRLNHVASKRDSTDWQGGFGLSLSTRYLSLQASTLWRENDAGYALGIASSL